MKARRHKRETFEKVELEDAEKVDKAYVHGWPRNIKDHRKRPVRIPKATKRLGELYIERERRARKKGLHLRVDLQVCEQNFELARRH